MRVYDFLLEEWKAFPKAMQLTQNREKFRLAIIL